MNAFQLLDKLSISQSSGHLQVSNGPVSWRISLERGGLKHASCSVQCLGQLVYYLRRLGCDPSPISEIPQSYLQDFDVSSDNPWEHESLGRAISWLTSEGYLDAPVLIQLIEILTKDVLESLLWVTQGAYHWFPAELGDPLLSRGGFILDLPPLLAYFQQRLHNWQQLAPKIRSPHQRPYFFPQSSQDVVPAGNLSEVALRKLSKIMRGLSIRQLVPLLKQDELKIAQLLLPYIQQGIIYLRDPQAPFNQLPLVPEMGVLSYTSASQSAKNSRFKIVCIDDSPTILEEMQRFLSGDRYEVIKVDDPVKASSMIFRLKPDLVLMDITMPEINGYKLCSLFRSSKSLADIPIVMVTGNKGIIDKARARMSGATDYLTKPFTKVGLLDVVSRYLEEPEDFEELNAFPPRQETFQPTNPVMSTTAISGFLTAAMTV